MELMLVTGSKALVLAIASIQTQGVLERLIEKANTRKSTMFVCSFKTRGAIEMEHRIFFCESGACAPLGGTPVNSPFASHLHIEKPGSGLSSGQVAHTA